MNDVTKRKDSFADAKYVVVLGGVVDCSGGLQESLKIYKVLQVGEFDLMAVETGSLTASFNKRPVIVPKDLCVPVRVSHEQLISSGVTQAELGDLVFFQGRQTWKDQADTQFAGILYEIVYSSGRPDTGKILVDGSLQEADYRSLLVLQKKRK